MIETDQSEYDERFTNDVNAVAQVVRESQRIVVLTGAGISAESGLPTYRGVGGLYNDMTVDEGLPIEQVLSGPMFATRPDVTWKYIAEIERACRGAKANAAHHAIKSLESHVEVWVVTQNVDGFHHEAQSENVVELHGNLSDISCTQCDFSFAVVDYSEINIPPTCDCCGSMMRPSVVLFEEMLPEGAMDAYEKLLRSGVNAFFSIGTTAGFPYIYEPVAQASQYGLPTVEINPDATPLSHIVQFKFDHGAGSVLSAIVAALENG